MSAAGIVAVTVVAISGDTVLAYDAESTDTVRSVKERLRDARPGLAVCWQTLLLAGGFGEGAVAEDNAALADCGGDSCMEVVFQLVSCTQIEDLASNNADIVEEVAWAIDSMYVGDAAELLDGLFECAPADVIGKVNRIGNMIKKKELSDWEKKPRSLTEICLPPFYVLKAACLPRVMEALSSQDLVQSGNVQAQISMAFGWLGPVMVPHVVSWLALLPRPLERSMLWRVQVFERFQNSTFGSKIGPPVRRAAKAALSNRAVVSKARVDELASLCACLTNKLRRSSAGYSDSQKAALASPEWGTLELLRQQANSALIDLRERAREDIKVRYEVDRAIAKLGLAVS
eukprot:TRINITY_DN43796_c0_g1_i1.p1 TRINITY_DN43796_c0_g1~~TRINITY_DN43796_c0_g1_i1.p1  ORF type:complete len:345 (+),score=80.86 TRINITY_DN43796_c0_g1_i1:87-1121(+)